MLLFGDYHTHTIYSRRNHGKGTVLENAQVAQTKGLKEIAITDHGYNHLCYSADRAKREQTLLDIEQAKQITGINVLFGMETNLLDLNGNIDLTVDDEKYMDIVLMGFHKLVKTYSIQDFWNLFAKNQINKWFHYSKSQIEKNTTAYLKALDKYNIDVLTHLNYGLPVDCIKIAELCNQKHTYIELNGKRTIFSPKEIEEMVAIGTKFIINSDAHKPTNVGECNLPTNIAIKNRIPQELIVNLDKKPIFKNHKK